MGGHLQHFVFLALLLAVLSLTKTTTDEDLPHRSHETNHNQHEGGWPTRRSIDTVSLPAGRVRTAGTYYYMDVEKTHNYEKRHYESYEYGASSARACKNGRAWEGDGAGLSSLDVTGPIDPPLPASSVEKNLSGPYRRLATIARRFCGDDNVEIAYQQGGRAVSGRG